MNPRRADRHLRRGHFLRGQLALGGRAVLHSHRQEAAQAGHRHRHSVQLGAAVAVPVRRRRQEPRPNLLILRIQPEEGSRCCSFPRSPAAACGCGRSRWTSTTARASVSDLLRLTRLCWWMPCRRSDALHPPGHGGSELAVIQPILEDWNNRRFDFPNYEPGTWGPAEADAMIARLGRQWRNS